MCSVVVVVAAAAAVAVAVAVAAAAVVVVVVVVVVVQQDWIHHHGVPAIDRLLSSVDLQLYGFVSPARRAC